MRAPATPILAAVLALCACGARTATRDVSAAACVTLRLGAVHSISDPSTSTSVMLGEAVAAPDGAIVVWTERFLDTSGTDAVRLRSRLVLADGSTPGDAHELVEDEATEWATPSLARGHGHAGVVQWTGSTGCRFVALHDDGSAAGAPVTLGSEDCYPLSASADGFTLVRAIPFGPMAAWHLEHLDATGRTVGASVPIPEPLHVARAMEGDGTFLALDDLDAAATCATCRVRFATQRVDVDETPLGASHALLDDAHFTDARAIAVSGSAALAAWTADTSSSSFGVVTVTPLDRDGAPTSATTTLPTETASAPSVGLAALQDGDFVLAWIGSGAGTVRVARLSPDGTLRDPVRTALVPPPAGTTTSWLRVVATSAGALVLVDQESRIVALPVTCVP